MVLFVSIWMERYRSRLEQRASDYNRKVSALHQPCGQQLTRGSSRVSVWAEICKSCETDGTCYCDKIMRSEILQAVLHSTCCSSAGRVVGTCCSSAGRGIRHVLQLCRPRRTIRTAVLQAAPYGTCCSSAGGAVRYVLQFCRPRRTVRAAAHCCSLRLTNKTPTPD
jgi:hypothetical protein